MAKYRVMAELSQLYEVEVEASNEDEAMVLAGEVDFWDIWDTTGLSDDFKILSAEEVE